MKKYKMETLIPPRLHKSLIDNKTYIIPHWIEVPNDTTNDQIEWIKYESKPEPIININIWNPEMGDNKYNTRFDSKTNTYQCRCPGFWRVKIKGECKHVKFLMSQSI